MVLRLCRPPLSPVMLHAVCLGPAKSRPVAQAASDHYILFAVVKRHYTGQQSADWHLDLQ